nr:NADPH--cytochrome P450 reductase isoform X5 [Mirounga angustirostris]
MVSITEKACLVCTSIFPVSSLFRLSGAQFPVNMGDSHMDASATVSETVAEEVSLLSMTDMILFSLIVGLLTYWFFFRKKKDEVPEFTKIQPTTSSVKDSSFVEKMKKTGRNIIVFYGSQTGTAEEFANRLSKDAHRYGMRGMAADPEEYDLADLGSLPDIENSLAVFCMATYGEGDPTDNAQDFYDWLQETNLDLTGVKYAVFGLGNKTYEHFNAMGKYVDKRLEQLGAQRIFELGMGDDDGNLEEDFLTWREQFWPAVCEHFGVEATGEECSIRQYGLVVHPDIDPAKVYMGEVGRLKSYENQKPPFDAKNPFLAAVTANRKLNQGTERHFMHLELDISGSKLRYESGDHVAIYPANDSTLVSQLGEILGADLDVVMSLNNLDEESNKKHPFPCPTSYRTALTYYLDITNPPRTNVLYELAQHASEPSEQEQLRRMASSSGEGKELYLSWVVEARRHILAILQDYPSLRPPIDHLCELLPRLQARYYSIASSSKVHPNSVHICAVAVEYETKSGRVNKGVATSWLRAKEPAGENGRRALVPMFVRKSQFRLPFKATTPVILVGPGTGVAPFIGFIQERAWLRQQGEHVGPGRGPAGSGVPPLPLPPCPARPHPCPATRQGGGGDAALLWLPPLRRGLPVPRGAGRVPPGRLPHPAQRGRLPGAAPQGLRAALTEEGQGTPVAADPRGRRPHLRLRGRSEHGEGCAEHLLRHRGRRGGHGARPGRGLHQEADDQGPLFPGRVELGAARPASAPRAAADSLPHVITSLAPFCQCPG